MARGTCLGWRGIYPNWGGGGILKRGYLPWTGGYLSWTGGYLSWTWGVPSFSEWYLPWMGGYLPCIGGTYLGRGDLPCMEVPTLAGVPTPCPHGRQSSWGPPPPPPHGRQSSTASTSGCISLAFTQEDFLVYSNRFNF